MSRITAIGGTYNKGTIFNLDPRAGDEARLHSFGAQGDGAFPNVGLAEHGQTFFGTTVAGAVRAWMTPCG